MTPDTTDLPDLNTPGCVPTGAEHYLGIDLSTDVECTRAAVVAEDPAGLLFAWELAPPATDQAIVDWFSLCAAMGIDGVLGWPIPFVGAVNQHQGGGAWPAPSVTSGPNLLFYRGHLSNGVKVANNRSSNGG